MNQRKVLGDTILDTKYAIFVLQQWRDLPVKWQTLGEIEPDIFADTCQQLKDAGLWQWASEAGGHGLEALARLDDIPREVLTNGNGQTMPWPINLPAAQAARPSWPPTEGSTSPKSLAVIPNATIP